MSDGSLVVSELRAGYSDVEVLRGIDLEVVAGTITTVIGPNGAGKSTLLKAIFGMTRVTGGSINYRGVELRDLPNTKLIGAGVAFVPQGRCNFPRMTVQENLEMGAFTLARKATPSALDRTYDRFPVLREKRMQPAGLMSGGQQQLLEMAMGLIVEPTLLLIDEPSLGLAPLTLTSVLDQVQLIRDSGVTVLMVEQNARQALARSDRGVVLELGRKAIEGTGAEMLLDPRLAHLYLGGSAVADDPQPEDGEEPR